MIVLLSAWLACLAGVVLMVWRAPLVEEDAAEDQQPDGTSNSSEYRAQALS